MFYVKARQVFFSLCLLTGYIVYTGIYKEQIEKHEYKVYTGIYKEQIETQEYTHILAA